MFRDKQQTKLERDFSELVGAYENRIIICGPQQPKVSSTDTTMRQNALSDQPNPSADNNVVDSSNTVMGVTFKMC